MRESEAKKKICPFIQNAAYLAFQKITTSSTISEIGGQPSNINCICGDCMAWKWTTTKSYKKFTASVDMHPYLIEDDLFIEETIIDGLLYYLAEDQDNNIKKGSVIYVSEDFELNDKIGYCQRIGQ